MIILFIVFIILFCTLFVKIPIYFFVKLENTRSIIIIKILFYKYQRNGKFVVKSKDRNNEDNKVDAKKKKLKISNKTKLYFLKKLNYDEIKINEKIGILDPSLTAISVPILSLVTTIPINYYNLKLKHFNYNIVPDYNNLIFKFELEAKASFRLISLMIGTVLN